MTVYGPCGISWEKSGNSFTVRVSVPVSCTAELRLPKLPHGKLLPRRLTESGRPLKDNPLIKTGKYGIIRFPSGKWIFVTDKGQS